VRCRPFSDKERSGGFSKVVAFPAPTTIKISNPKIPDDIKEFTFDSVFDEASEQIAVYDSTARGIVEAVLTGYNGTVFVCTIALPSSTYFVQSQLSWP
jgi:kinesin family protein 3/17